MLRSLDTKSSRCHGRGTFSATATRGARNDDGRYDWDRGRTSGGGDAEGAREGGEDGTGAGGCWFRRAWGAEGGAIGMSDPWAVSVAMVGW